MTETAPTGSGGLPCVFFDRDGIVNVAPQTRYVDRAADFHIYPEFFQALQLVVKRGYAAVIVTNQKGVSTGFTPREELAAMHDRLRREAELVGAPLTAVYACTAPDDADPERKPNPGMLLRAAKEHGLDLARSWMVGDNGKDIAAGQGAGCAVTVFVGSKTIEEVPTHRVERVADLLRLFDTELPDLAKEVA
jgi:D-glycero-D-manno-heptose 1,7-bisphosphate phosphatase